VEAWLFFKATDDELMQKVASGSEAAFRSLFDRHGSRILGYCCRFMGSEPRGEDVAQEVWMKVIRASKEYQAEGKFAAWVLTIARRACLSAFRERSDNTEISFEAGIEADIPDLDRQTVEEELSQNEIDRLPDQQRIALLMWMTNESSYEEIAAELRLSVAAVKSLLFRARRSLENVLRTGS
jgi:RNA polymerase sigma-70 factor (ECF subfamily)